MAKFDEELLKFNDLVKKEGENLFSICTFDLFSLTEHNSTGRINTPNGEQFTISINFNQSGRIVNSICSCKSVIKCSHLYAYLMFLNEYLLKNNIINLKNESPKEISNFLYRKGYRKLENNNLSDYIDLLENNYTPESISVFLNLVLKNWLLTSNDIIKILCFIDANYNKEEYTNLLMKIFKDSEFDFYINSKCIIDNINCIKNIKTILKYIVEIKLIPSNSVLRLILKIASDGNKILNNEYIKLIFNNKNKTSILFDFYPNFINGLNEDFDLDQSSKILKSLLISDRAIDYSSLIENTKHFSEELYVHSTGTIIEHLIKTDTTYFINDDIKFSLKSLSNNQLFKKGYTFAYIFLANKLNLYGFDKNFHLTSIDLNEIIYLPTIYPFNELKDYTKNITIINDELSVPNFKKLLNVLNEYTFDNSFLTQILLNTNFQNKILESKDTYLIYLFLKTLDDKDLLDKSGFTKGTLKCF